MKKTKMERRLDEWKEGRKEGGSGQYSRHNGKQGWGSSLLLLLMVMRMTDGDIEGDVDWW